jgi:hypothetical protein
VASHFTVSNMGFSESRKIEAQLPPASETVGCDRWMPDGNAAARWNARFATRARIKRCLILSSELSSKYKAASCCCNAKRFRVYILTLFFLRYRFPQPAELCSITWHYQIDATVSVHSDALES